MVLHRISEKFSRNSFFFFFFSEIPSKNLDWIWHKMRQISGQTEEYSPRKKIKQFHTQTIHHFCPGSDEWKIYCQSCGRNLGLKSTPKLSRHSEQCLVKISDQNTQGVRRSNSQTQSEQNWFSENKSSWLFYPVSSFCDFFMDVSPYLAANNTRKYLCEFFQRNTDPEKNCRKQGRISQVSVEDSLGFAQNFWKVVPK